MTSNLFIWNQPFTPPFSQILFLPKSARYIPFPTFNSSPKHSTEILCSPKIHFLASHNKFHIPKGYPKGDPETLTSEAL